MALLNFLNMMKCIFFQVLKRLTISEDKWINNHILETLYITETSTSEINNFLSCQGRDSLKV